MHFSAKRGIATACRLSVRLSVTLVDCDHIGWNTSEIISPLVSLGCSQIAAEWLQIAQRSQWRAYRKLPSLSNGAIADPVRPLLPPQNGGSI